MYIVIWTNNKHRSTLEQGTRTFHVWVMLGTEPEDLVYPTNKPLVSWRQLQAVWHGGQGASCERLVNPVLLSKFNCHIWLSAYEKALHHSHVALTMSLEVFKTRETDFFSSFAFAFPTWTHWDHWRIVFHLFVKQSGYKQLPHKLLLTGSVIMSL